MEASKSTCIKPPPEQPFRFMDLPPEIRNLVYHFVLPTEPWKPRRRSGNQRRGSITRYQSDLFSPLDIMHTSRQIRFEFRSFFFRHAEVHVSGVDIRPYIDMLIQTRVQVLPDGTSPTDYTKILENLTLVIDDRPHGLEALEVEYLDIKPLLLLLIQAPGFRFRTVNAKGGEVKPRTYLESELWKNDKHFDIKSYLNGAVDQVLWSWARPETLLEFNRAKATTSMLSRRPNWGSKG